MSTIGQQLSTQFTQSGNRQSNTSSTYTNSQGDIIGGMAQSAGKLADAAASGNPYQTKEALIEAANNLADLRMQAVEKRHVGSTESLKDFFIKQEKLKIESEKQNSIAQAIAWFNGQVKMNPFEAFKDMMRKALDGGIPSWLHDTKIT